MAHKCADSGSRDGCMSFSVHPTALIEEDVSIGNDTRIWDNVHVRHSTTIGDECIVGEKSHISYAVQVGNRVKINAFVYICTGVKIEDGVMISAGVVFTNDVYPRATTPDLQRLLSSDPNEDTGTTRVCCGATLGAGCIVGTNLTIGCFATVGMGSVVTRSVPDFHLCYGNPAKSTGYVCRCGIPLLRFAPDQIPESADLFCRRCERAYSVANGRVLELQPAERR